MAARFCFAFRSQLLQAVRVVLVMLWLSSSAAQGILQGVFARQAGIGTSSGRKIGRSMALSDEAQLLVVGASSDPSLSATEPAQQLGSAVGAAHVFSRSPTSVTYERYLKHPAPREYGTIDFSLRGC